VDESFISPLRDIFCDRGYDRGRLERNFTKYEAKVSLQYLNESNEDNDMRRDVESLAMVNVRIVELSGCLANIRNFNRGPQEFKDDGLPYIGLARAIEEEMLGIYNMI
jgi:hypothetical protein